MKYQEILNQGSKILKLNDVKSYNLDSEILLSSSLKLDRSQLLLNLDKIIETFREFFRLYQMLIYLDNISLTIEMYVKDLKSSFRCLIFCFSNSSITKKQFPS